MLEVGTKVRRKYDSGLIGFVSVISKREVVRDRHNDSTEVVYEVGAGDFPDCYTEEQLRRKFVFVDDKATAVLNEEDDTDD